MRMVRYALLAIVGCAGLAFADPSAAREARTDKLAILAPLQQRNFDGLDRLFGAIQAKIETGAIADTVLRDALAAFENSNPELETSLTRWIHAAPRSAYAHLARGAHYFHIAWISRGEDVSEQVPVERLQEMDRVLALALPDFETAVAIAPRVSPSYGYLIDIANLIGNRDAAIQVLGAAVAANGWAITPHWNFLKGLEPRAGGSLKLIEQYVAVLLKHAETNSHLASLRGYYQYALGIVRWQKGECLEAIADFDRAYALGPAGIYLLARAECNYALGRIDEAIADIERVLRAEPQNDDGLSMLAATYHRQGDVQKALAYYTEALRFDTHNPSYLMKRHALLMSLNRIDEAGADLETALGLGRLDPHVRMARANFLVRYRHDATGAVNEAREAVALAQSDTRYLIQYARLLWSAKDCRAKDVLEEFHRQCTPETCALGSEYLTPEMVNGLSCGGKG